MNESAREWVRAKNVPDVLNGELSAWYTVVFEVYGEVVGLGALGSDEFKRIYIDVSYQRQGIGSSIVAVLELL